jgi:hypothetical protein
MSDLLSNTRTSKNDTANGVTDAEQAKALLIADSGQFGLAYGMHVVGPESSGLQERAALAMKNELASFKSVFPTMVDGITMPAEALTAGKAAGLLPPLIIIGSASYAAINFGKCFYDSRNGDTTKSFQDMSNANEGFSATIGSAIGFIAAERYGIPKWVGTSAGALVGSSAYRVAEHLLARS